MPFKEYQEIVGTAAGISTMAQCLAPAVMCYDIYKKKSTVNVDSTPFVGGMGICILMLQHGLLLNDPAMIPVNLFGIALNIVYFSIYYYYNDEKSKLLTTCAKFGAFVAVLVGYAQLDNPKRAEFNFGIILTVLMICLVSAPLFSLGEIIRTKSSATLPLPLIVSGTLVSSLWLLYGFIIENVFVQLQNVVGFSLCLIQLSIIAIYPRTPPAESLKKKSN